MRTVIGIYDTEAQARDVVEALVDAGFRRENISIATRVEGEQVELEEAEEGTEAGEGAAAGAGVGAVLGGVAGLLVGLGTLVVPGLGFIVAAGPIVGLLSGAVAGGVAGGIIGALIGLGIPEEEAEVYAEAVRRGNTLVAIRTADEDVGEAEMIMNRYNPVDMERRSERWREAGWEGFEEETEPYTEEELEEIRAERETWMEEEPFEGEVVEEEEEAEIDVVEEEMRVGKRDVETGGVRVRTYVVEEPVEEQVRLRRERVEVEREPVDREARDVDFEEGEEVIELEETAEEVVVDKEARVTEEVRVSKEAEEETETVRDTLRRREVEVEEIGAEEGEVEGVGVGAEEWTEYEPEFREHYETTYANTGREWTYYQAAYRYGYNLAHERGDVDWDELEPEARRRWEETNGPGTWPEARDAVRVAYIRSTT